MSVEPIGHGYLVSFHFDAMVIRLEIDNVEPGELLDAIDDKIQQN